MNLACPVPSRPCSLHPRAVRFLGFALLVFALGMQPAAALAETPEDARRSARAIYGDFMSPYCPGLLLADCRSPAAVDLRAEIRRSLEAGASEADVRGRIEAQFGEKLRAAPRGSGFGLLAWTTPFVAIALAGIAIFAWMFSHRGQATPAARVAALDPVRLARLEEERRLAL